jgi:peptidoglycan/xylan/chitin deacetylase (PgdA/CDA1 family)
VSPSAEGHHASDVREPDLWPERLWRHYKRHGNRNSREVALTFDDGPGAHTLDILEVLAAFDAKASFFIVGERVPGSEDLIRHMVVAGHELGNHSMTHANLAGRPVAAYREIRTTNALLRRLTGCAPRVFRAPFGTVSRGVVAAARLAGLTTVAWDVDSGDWASPGQDAISEAVLGAVRGGSIVLMHDGRGPREQTLAALPGIIEGLSERGYRLVTTSRVLRHWSARACG